MVEIKDGRKIKENNLCPKCKNGSMEDRCTMFIASWKCDSCGHIMYDEDDSGGIWVD